MTLAALATAGLIVAAAPASKAKQAAALAHRSITEYNAGQFDAALEDATDAYLADPKPGLLFNLGQCHRALHNWERAEFNYRRYLAEQPDAPNRKSVEGLIAEMQAKQQEEAAKAAPVLAPVAPILVEAPPPAPAPKAAPAAAVTAPAAPAPRKHTLGIVLGATGLAFLGLMAASIYEVVSYNNQYGSGAQKNTVFSQNAYKQAEFFQYAEFVSGALGVAGVTSGALTW